MSFGQEPYDPSEVQERPRSGHLTRKDLRRLVTVFAVLGVLCIPIYITLRKSAETAICANNFKGMQIALLAYMAQNDDHFPPICDQNPDGSPFLHDGKPYTWASVIQPLMGERFSFKCPSARDEELVHSLPPTNAVKDLPTSYGMYSPWSTAATSNISDPGSSVVISETSNFGTQDTYDPAPFIDPRGNKIPIDGFVIGWEGGNYPYWSQATSAADMPRHVTRLAFSDTAGGRFGPNAHPRHSDGIHVLYVDGHIGVIGAGDAAVRYTDVGGYLNGKWSTRGWPGGALDDMRRRARRDR